MKLTMTKECVSHFTVCSWRGWSCFWQTKVNLDSVPIVLSFFLSPQDDYPLASLPLLGYSVTIPSESENIHKDYVFKLHFKSHVYYFRSESEYTFERYGCTLTKRICSFVHSRMSEKFKIDSKNVFCARRWMEVIRSATIPSSVARVLNNKESHPHWSRLTHTPSPLGGVCPSCPPTTTPTPWTLCFSFLRISGTFVHVSMHIWCFLML